MAGLSYGHLRDLGGLPELLSSVTGGTGVAEVFRAEDLPISLLDSPDALVPMRNLVELYHRASVISGIRSIGLEASRSVAITDFGAFGGYVSQTPNLYSALKRTQSYLPYYESGSEMSVKVAGDELIVRYRNAYQELNGWRHAGDFTLCSIASVITHYLGTNWTPVRIETCYDTGRWLQDHEDLFGAPIIPTQDWIAIVLDRDLAQTTRQVAPAPGELVSRRDVIQLGEALPQDFAQAVANIIDRHLRAGVTDIEGTAWALGLGPRTMQRRLSEHGLTYRELLLNHRMRRARELLAEPELSVDQISREVGYASTPQFTRAFKSRVGTRPVDFRKH